MLGLLKGQQFVSAVVCFASFDELVHLSHVCS